MPKEIKIDISKYLRYKRGGVSTKPEKSKDESTQYGRRRYYNNIVEKITNVESKKETKIEDKQENNAFKRSYYGTFGRIKIEQKEEPKDKKQENKLQYSKGKYRRIYSKEDIFKKEEKNKIEEKRDETKPSYYGKYLGKYSRDNNNNNNLNYKANTNYLNNQSQSNQNSSNYQNRFAYRVGYLSNNIEEKDKNNKIVENVVTRKEVYKSNYIPKSNITTISTTTTTSTLTSNPSSIGTKYSLYRRRNEKNKEDEQKLKQVMLLLAEEDLNIYKGNKNIKYKKENKIF